MNRLNYVNLLNIYVLKFEFVLSYFEYVFKFDRKCNQFLKTYSKILNTNSKFKIIKFFYEF